VIGAVRFLLLLALGLWIGEIVFFSFVVAPTLFGTLGAARAGEVTSVLFPRYYALGTATAIVATACAAALTRRATAPAWGTAAVFALGVGLAATLWAAFVVHPRAQRLRTTVLAAGGVPGEDDAFRRAHRDAVALNGVTLLAAVAGLALVCAGLRE
jgi:hypothetical protein